MLEAETCSKCGGPLTRYVTHEHYTTVDGEIRTYVKRVMRCKACYNAKRREWNRSVRDKRKDKSYYIRDLLSMKRKPTVKRQHPSFWPQWLVELKHCHLKLLRLCRK